MINVDVFVTIQFAGVLGFKANVVDPLACNSIPWLDNVTKMSFD